MKTFLIVDLQNDFIRNGALSVPGSESIISIINHLIPYFSCVIASKDWHPENHMSFASSDAKGLWPDHCIQESKGAEFPQDLNEKKIEKVFYKGTLLNEDSYSAFFNGSSLQSTGLNEFLKNRETKELFIVGIVLEYCVLETIKDALRLGYQVSLVEEGIAFFSLDFKKQTLEKLKKEGVKIYSIRDIQERLLFLIN